MIYETGFCTKNVYLYVQLNDFQKNATLEVSSSIISKEVCNSIKDQNKFVKCGSITLTECRDNCVPDCQFVSCQKDLNEVFGFCLPLSLNETEVKDKCAIMPGINSFKISNKCKEYLPKTKAIIEHDPWIIVIMVFFFLWVLSVCCYNWRFAKTGTPPFPVPDFCPESCYPRE